MTKSYFVRQVTVQYKWIQYCGLFFFFFLLIHLDLALDHVATGVRDRLRTECGNIDGAEAKRYLPTLCEVIVYMQWKMSQSWWKSFQKQAGLLCMLLLLTSLHG